MANCEGSGFCCKTGPCGLYWRTRVSEEQGLTPWYEGRGCPLLVWDPEAFRYWCGLILEADGPELRAALAIGEGCCCPLGNTERKRR